MRNTTRAAKPEYDQRQDGVEEARDAHGSEHADPHVVDKLDNSLGDLDSLGSEGLQDAREERVDPVVGAEGRQHGKAHRGEGRAKPA